VLTRGFSLRSSHVGYARASRTRLKHNMAHVTLSDLLYVSNDTPPTRSPSRNSYHDAFADQGNNVTNPSGSSARKGYMAPLSMIPSSNPRDHQASPGKRESTSAKTVQGLYASILTPPPAKPARTIHNPEDPPVPAPANAPPILKGPGVFIRAQPPTLSPSPVLWNIHAPVP